MLNTSCIYMHDIFVKRRCANFCALIENLTQATESFKIHTFNHKLDSTITHMTIRKP